MRLRHPVLAAGALGVVGSLLPAGEASAAAAPRTWVHDEVVVIRRADGSTYDCQLHARLTWNLGEPTPADDRLYAQTTVHPQPGDAPECEFSVRTTTTLRWFDGGNGISQNYTFSAESGLLSEVISPPPFTEDGNSYEDVSSEHRWEFSVCASGCVHTHTINAK